MRRRATAWAADPDEEMSHDGIFAKGLAFVGVTREVTYAHEPFLSTKALIGYLLYERDHDDRPMALIASDHFMNARRRGRSRLDRRHRPGGCGALWPPVDALHAAHPSTRSAPGTSVRTDDATSCSAPTPARRRSPGAVALRPLPAHPAVPTQRREVTMTKVRRIRVKKNTQYLGTLLG